MVDGVHFAQHLCVVALGIGIDGTKHPLALVEGDTENATVVKRLLVGLRERGLDVTKPTLFVLDGAKALASAVKAVFDHPVIARCEEHKVRNVRRHLPKGVARHRRAPHARRLSQPRPAGRPGRPRGARQASSIAPIPAPPLRCAKDWPRPSPSAASVSHPTLARTLRSTNAIESMIEICRDHSTNVKRWRDGQMALRWCAAGMLEAKKQFRRVNGHLHLKALRTALEAHVGGACHTRILRYEGGGGRIANKPVAVTEIPRRSGHPRAPSRFPHPL